MTNPWEVANRQPDRPFGLDQESLTNVMLLSYQRPVNVTVPDPRDHSKTIIVGHIIDGTLTWIPRQMDYYMMAVRSIDLRWDTFRVDVPDNSPSLGGKLEDNSPMLGGDRRQK